MIPLQTFILAALFLLTTANSVFLPWNQSFLRTLLQNVDLSQNHRMIWIGRHLIDDLIPTLCHGQGHLPLEQAAQSPIRPGLEHCRGGGIHIISGKSVPVSHHPLAKNLFLISDPLSVPRYHIRVCNLCLLQL